MKIVRLLLGLLLLPVCAAVALAVFNLVYGIRPADPRSVPLSFWVLGGGFVLWLVLWYTLPRPMRTYVLAHELTHALWGWVMGAKVARMKVSKSSGSVSLSKNNFLIALSPYFFPLYTVLVIVLYYLLYIFVEVERFVPLWLGLIGFTWGFHLTFTFSMLLNRQSDIRAYGRVFSYTIILLLNILGIGLWVVMVSAATLEQMDVFVREGCGTVFGGMRYLAQHVFAALKQ